MFIIHLKGGFDRMDGGIRPSRLLHKSRTSDATAGVFPLNAIP